MREELRPVFGNRLKFCVDRKAGPERSRVNALNTRLRTTDGKVHLLVDPVNCRNLVRDFESVTVVEGGSGELNKSADNGRFSHASDSISYGELKRYPLHRDVIIQTPLY
ncbi:MAG: hypothetical protein ACYTGW_15910 [Planctomycetota bacterium]